MSYEETIQVAQDEIERINTLLQTGQVIYDGETAEETEQVLRDIEDGQLISIKIDGEEYDALDVRFDDGLMGDVRVRGGRGPYVTFSLFEETDEGFQEVATHGSVREQLDTEWELEHDGTTYRLSIEPEEG